MEKIQLWRRFKHPRNMLQISWLHILTILFPYLLDVAWRFGLLINQFWNIRQSLFLISILTILIHLQLSQNVATGRPTSQHLRPSLELRNEGRSFRRVLALVDIFVHETVGLNFFQSQHAAAAASLILVVVTIADVYFR